MSVLRYRKKEAKERKKEIAKKLKELSLYLCGEMLECEGAVTAYKMHLELQRDQNKKLIRENRTLKIEIRDLKKGNGGSATFGTND